MTSKQSRLCVDLTCPSLLLLAQENVEVARALWTQGQQQRLEHCRSTRQTKQQGPHVIVAEDKFQAYYLCQHAKRGGVMLLCV